MVAALTLGMSALDGRSGSGPVRAPALQPVVHLPVEDFSGISGRPTRRRVAPGPGLVALDGYTGGGRTLVLRYTIRTRRCSGRIQPPAVVESVDAVTVTLRRQRSGAGPTLRCPPLTLSDSVQVRLTAPLAGREVRDGARDGAPVPRQPR
jgi:hypothetical protein